MIKLVEHNVVLASAGTKFFNQYEPIQSFIVGIKVRKIYFDLPSLSYRMNQIAVHLA